jgi:hypothetical protein
VSGVTIPPRSGPAIRARHAAAIAFGALALLWPALVNFYPLVFSDTGAFLAQFFARFMVWDKPWIYGPVLGAVSAGLSLWLPAIAQALLVSATLWAAARVLGAARPARHVALCLLLAALSTAPWFASLLMPDILAPLLVLALFLLAFAPGPARRWPWALLATFCIAAHLAHLVIAAAVLAVIALLRPRRLLPAAVPLAAALALLLATNLAGHGRLAVSPYGAVFFLSRLVADGPARDHIRAACPASGYALCAWADRLPTDSDAFMWDPNGPVWSHPGGPPGLAPEAGRIVTATILGAPGAVARDMARNTAAQLVQVRLGETLGNYYLDETVGKWLREAFPAAEAARFRAALQFQDRIAPIAAPLQAPQSWLLLPAALACGVLALARRRRAPRQAALASLVLAGVLANAFATGALAGPHDRYGARIAWLLLVPPALAVLARPPRA